MSEKIYRVGDPEAPEGAYFLRPEQEASIRRMMAEPTHAVCNASEMDTGKTAITAEFIVRMGLERVLYGGVKDTYSQWASRLAAQSDGAIRLLRIDSTKQGQANFAALLAGEPGHFFVGAQYLTSKDWHYEDKRDETGALVYVKDKKTGLPTDKVEKIRYHDFIYKKMRPLDLMVFDEVHMVANRKSLGARTLKTIPTDWKIALSGTWVGNRFENAQTVSGWLWPDLIDPNASRWRAEWCATETPKRRGGMPVLDKRGNPIQLVTGEKEPGKFVSTLPCYIRLESEVKVPDPEVVVVPLLPQQRADYEALEEDGLVWLQAHPNLEPLVTSLPITKRLRLRQVTLGVVSWTHDGKIDFAYDTQSTKLYALRGVLDRPEWTGRQVGIYVNSKKFAKVVVARMRAAGYNAVEWSGDISSKRREGIKKAWLAGEITYLVSVIRSFSTGLDEYQFVCNRVVWLAEDDNNTANQQAIKRYCRTGDPVMLADFRHVKIVAENTLDAGIHFGNIAKTERMRATIGIAA